MDKEKTFEEELKVLLNKYDYEITTEDDNSITILKKKYVPTQKWIFKCPHCQHIFENDSSLWDKWVKCECGEELFVHYPPDHPLYKKPKRDDYSQKMKKFVDIMEHNMERRVAILKDCEEILKLND